MLIYVSLIVIIVLSLVTGLITTIIEKKELKAQRTQVYKAIKEEKDKRAAQEIVSKSLEVPEVKQTIDILDLTQQIEVLDLDDYEEDKKVIKTYDEEII